MAIFPRLARGDIFGIISPSNLLATVTDSKDGYAQVKHGRVDIFPESVQVFRFMTERTYEEPLRPVQMRDLGTKSVVVRE